MKKKFHPNAPKGHKQPHRHAQQNQAHQASPRAEPQTRAQLYGVHAVREAYLNPHRVVQALYITEEAEKNFAPIIQQAAKAGLNRPRPTMVDKRGIERMLPAGAVHQGLALRADDLPELEVQDIIIRCHDLDHAVVLMLDQVTDPHNVGAILRSASAFGAQAVIMQRRHAPELSGVLAKTACGAVDHVAVAQATNLSRALEEFKEGGFFVVGLDERGQPLGRGAVKSGKIVLVLGAEGDGMRRLISEHCDEILQLPTTGAIRSLNVSNAAAVALFTLCVR